MKTKDEIIAELREELKDQKGINERLYEDHTRALLLSEDNWKLKTEIQQLKKEIEELRKLVPDTSAVSEKKET